MKILGSTLRDGGYCTSWDFSKQRVDNYIWTMNHLPVDYLESLSIQKVVFAPDGWGLYISRTNISGNKSRILNKRGDKFAFMHFLLGYYKNFLP
ncbi:MAG: hypothetical protein V4592_20300 [Bacteroidota bacterium]